MKNGLSQRIYIIVLGIILIFVAVFLYICFQSEKDIVNKKTHLDRITINGTYTTEIDAKEIPIKKGFDNNAHANKTITIIGHFDKEIKEGQRIFFKNTDLRIKIYLNDKEIYCFGEDTLSFLNTPGDTWDVFTAPHISELDEIKIEITPVYRDNIYENLDNFINQIYTGDLLALFIKLLNKYKWDIILGSCIFLEGFFMVVVMLLMYILRTPLPAKYTYFGLYSIAAGIWIFSEYNIITLIFPYPLFLCFLEYICLMLMFPFFLMYIANTIDGRVKRRILRLVIVWSIIIISFIVLQFLGIFDFYDLVGLRTIAIGFTIFYCSICIFSERNRVNSRKLKFLFSTLIAIFAFVILVCINYFVKLIPDNLMTNLSVFLFNFFHFISMIISGREGIIIKRKEDELKNELKITSMMNQIQPHFIFNALNSIRYLCKNNPQQAVEAINDFSNYLRGNLDSLNVKKLISFEQELNHVKHYLAIEKLRFKDRLNICYDLKVTDFYLPCLSLQPVVENAVRYGIARKKEGGMVKISTYKSNKNIVILIEDNGKGFELDKINKDGNTHVGIQNVMDRIKIQCNGKMVIESKLNLGTTVKIIIYEEGVKHENCNC